MLKKIIFVHAFRQQCIFKKHLVVRGFSFWKTMYLLLCLILEFLYQYPTQSLERGLQEAQVCIPVNWFQNSWGCGFAQEGLPQKKLFSDPIEVLVGIPEEKNITSSFDALTLLSNFGFSGKREQVGGKIPNLGEIFPPGGLGGGTFGGGERIYFFPPFVCARFYFTIFTRKKADFKRIELLSGLSRGGTIRSLPDALTILSKSLISDLACVSIENPMIDRWKGFSKFDLGHFLEETSPFSVWKSPCITSCKIWKWNYRQFMLRLKMKLLFPKGIVTLSMKVIR